MLKDQQLILQLSQLFIIYSCRLTYPMKQEEKPLASAKQKKAVASRDFIKMKRLKMKEEKANESFFGKMKQFIIDEAFKEFNQQIENQKPQIIMNFIFSQNQYKEIPYYDIIRAKNIDFLKAISAWSAKNLDFIKMTIENQRLAGIELQDKSWQNKFLVMNKFVADYFGNVQNESELNKQKLKVLGLKQSIFHILAQRYLTLQIIISTINSVKFPMGSLRNVYYYLYENSDLREKAELAVSIKSYYLILRADQIWENVEKMDYIKKLKQSEIDLLKLNELGFTYWHEFAVNNPKIFLDFCHFIEEETEELEFSSKWEELLLQFDNSGQLAIDKCLRLWNFKDIFALLNNYNDLKNVILSTSCLNNILANRKLSQSEKETLIQECLNGRISQKGYAQPIRETKAVNKGKVQVVYTNKYECTIFFDKNMPRTQEDTAGNYPLLAYLKLYKQKSNLRTIDLLWFSALDKKNIKKKYLLFLSILTSSTLQIDLETDYQKQIQVLYDYYQPLWIQLTSLPHCEVFEHFVNKCYLNVFQMSFCLNKAKSTASVYFFGKHFLNYYIQAGKCLDKNRINQDLLAQILDCKQKQKNLNQFKLNQHLIASFSLLDLSKNQKTFVVETLRSHYNSFIEIGISREDLLKNSPMLHNSSLIQYICRYLVGKKKHIIPFFRLQILVKKLSVDYMQQVLQLDEVYDSQFDLVRVKNIYRDILAEIGKVFQEKNKKSSKQEIDDEMRNFVSSYFYKLPQFGTVHKIDRSYQVQLMQVSTFQGIYENIKTTSHYTKDPRYRYGFIRLQANATYMETKMLQSLINGFDVYFNKYLQKPPALQNISDELIKKLIMKMYNEKCSFLNALLTTNDVSIEFIKKTIQSYQSPLLKTSFERILRKIELHERSRNQFNKLQLSFVSSSKDLYNIQLIIDLVHLANKIQQERTKSEKEEYSLVQTVKLFFQENVQSLLHAITKAESHLKANPKKKEQISLELNKKQKDFEEYTLQWFQKLSKLGRDEEQNKKIYDEIMLPILTLSERKKMFAYYNKFIQSLDLRQVFNHQLCIKKISVTNNIQQEFLSLFTQITGQEFENWVANCYLKQLLKSLAKFSYQGLLKMNSKLVKQYDECFRKSIDKSQPDQDIKKSNMRFIIDFIRNVHKIVPIDHKIQNFLIMKESEELCKNLGSGVRQMIMSTQSWANSTAGLVILSPQEQFVFYMKQNGKVTGYTNYTFYNKSSQQNFVIYLKNLAKYRKYCPNLAKHLQIVSNGLINTQNWGRLLKLIDIVQIQHQLISLVFGKLYHTTNLQIIKKDAQFQKVVGKLFQLYSKCGLQWSQPIFQAAFYFDYQNAMKVLTPKLLSLKAIRNCILQHPEASSILLKTKLQINDANNPEEKIIKRWFPCLPHYVHCKEPSQKLIQELRLQNVILASINQQKLMLRTNKCWLSDLNVAPYRMELFNPSEYPDQVCKAIFTNNAIISFQPFAKTIDKIDNSLQIYLNKGSVGRKKEIKCVNLQNTNAKLIQQLIKLKYFKVEEPSSQHSIFLRLLETSNLQLLNLFISQYKITVNYKFLKEIDNFGFTFWDHLLTISNQKYIIQLISHFNLFQMFPIEMYSPALLNSICKNKLNLLLEYTINDVANRFKVKPIFAAAIENDPPKITNQGFFYMPVEVAVDFSYYECYFLIRGCDNQCPKFRLSSRFLSKQDPSKWSFIPEMKRRLEINNSLMQTLREAQTQQFRYNVLLPMIFQLTAPEQKFSNTKSYLGSLLKLLQNIIEKKGSFEEVGIFQKLTVLILNKEKTRIPEEEIEKKYTSQMNLMKKLEKYVKQIDMNYDMESIFISCSQFKPLLLLYNPEAFFSSETFVEEMIGSQTSVNDYIEFLLGIQVNLFFIEQNHPQKLNSYIFQNFFKEGMSVFTPTSSLHLKRQVLLLLLLDIWYHDRKWEQSFLYSTLQMNSIQQPVQKERLLQLIARQLNTRGESGSFDLMLWNKMLIQLQDISKMQEKLKVRSFCQHKFIESNLNSIVQSYVDILQNRLQLQSIKVDQKKLVNTFRQLYSKQLNYRREGLFIEFTFLMNVCYLQNELKVLKAKVQQLVGPKLESATILNNLLKQISILGTRNLNNAVALLQFNSKTLFEEIRTQIYFIKLQEDNRVYKLDNFFQSKDRNQFFRNYKTAVNVHSFHAIQNIDLLQTIFDYGPYQTSGLIFKVIQDVQKIQQKLTGNRNIKLYNLSDVFGPVNFNQASAEKIFDCLGFYELLELPKRMPIEILFCDKVPSKQDSNEKMLQHIKQYLNYYVKNSKEEQEVDLKIDNQILVYFEEKPNKQVKVEISWINFAAWSVAQVAATLLNYCSEISRKIQKVLDVRISYSSIIDYYSYAFKYDQGKSFKQSIQELVFAKNFVGLVQSLMLMITEDVRNIMKLVKGIIIKFEINKSKAKTRVKILEKCYAAEVDYEVKQSLLYVIIQLQLEKSIPQNATEDYMKLVSRKKFLDTVFQSSQFLTDYFLIRRTLDNLCLQLSTEISKKLNTVIHFHIQYANLYIYVDQLRNLTSIKQIEGFLSNLKQYLQTNIDKVVNQYLSSPELANKHQICLLNKCEAIHRDLSLAEIQSAKYLIYDSIQTQNKSGLTEITKLMADIGHDQNIKNAFLIQIYKSSYSSVVAQGMTFVVGYQSAKKKSEVISIKKAENVNQINVVQLDFILVVSKSIPTNDELNNSKIIRIFVTDSNWNLYRVSESIRSSLLALPNQHQQRNIAEFAPIIAPNLKLLFTSGNSVQEDTKDTKIFYLDLGAPQKFGEEKFKLKPVQDSPTTSVQNLKKSVQFKQSINKLKAGLCAFSKSSITIIIDPPSEINEITSNSHFDHIVSLVVGDLLEMLSRFEYQPMRNEDLDCKLSVEKKIPINQNSIVQLRKRLFLKHYKVLRIKISDKDSLVFFEGNEIVVNISYLKLKVLPSSAEYLSSILQNLIQRQKSNLPSGVVLESKLQNQSSDVLLKMLDLFNIIQYQIEEIELARELSHLLFNTKLSRYEISFNNRKAMIGFEDVLKMSFNLQSVEREFYSAELIIRKIGLKIKFSESQNQQLFARYLFQTNQIEIIQPSETSYQLLALSNNKWSRFPAKIIKQQGRSLIALQFKHTPSTKFFLVDSENSITSNYFYSIAADSNPIKTKNYQGVLGKPNEIYLQCPKKINFNTTTLSVTKRDPFLKEISNNFNVRRPEIRDLLEIFLISSNLFKFIIKSQESASATVHHTGHPNLFNKEIESTTIIITSDGEMSLDNTKFVMLEPYKKKPVTIKDKQNVLVNSDFREPSEQASKELFQIRMQDAKNIQNMVYVINDECKRYLTRAGEVRIDYIQFCDASGNPINYNKQFQVFFLHINKLALIRPEIVKRGVDVGLRWIPIVRGHYYIYINNIRMNPPYEIGVCASQADCANTKVVAPKIHKICFCEESQIMLDLRDSYGNIYSQLQQQILGDELMIDFETDKLGAFLKVNKSQINKYGLKKVKFHFNHTEGHENTKVDLKVLLNRQLILQFSLDIEGYSLEQRKKLLDKDVSSKDKKYYKELVVNRNRFLEDLITHAEKSLHASLTIRYVNEPGIDAGGVKREFYDMVGNQMKSEKNPFFKEVNKSRMEYFLNPQILKNKKKLEYMQLWGKYLANSILNNYLIGISFSPVFIQMLYGQTLTYQDLLQVVPEDEKKQYLYLLSASAEEFEDFGLYFTVVLDKKRAVEVQLKQGGKSIPVTASNVKEYLHLLTVQLLNNRYKQLVQAFKQGFQTVLELTIITKWIRPSQFWCLTTGTKQITPEIVLDYIHFQGSGNIENITGWFRRYISEAALQILTGFLKFSSGSSSIDFSRSSKISVTFQNAGENPKKLPISHTCWKEIVVPKYKNFDIMKKLLNAAFIYCSEGFGFG